MKKDKPEQDIDITDNEEEQEEDLGTILNELVNNSSYVRRHKLLTHGKAELKRLAKLGIRQLSIPKNNWYLYIGNNNENIDDDNYDYDNDVGQNEIRASKDDLDFFISHLEKQKVKVDKKSKTIYKISW